MTELSPAAQAVFDAANGQPRYGCHGPWIADALEALAKEVAPADFRSRRQTNINRRILAIAAELRNESTSEGVLGMTDSTTSRWQSIDSAPDDGTEILATDYDSIDIINSSGRHWENRDGNFFYPCLWQPLPDVTDLPDHA
jgi:hypothetical protein